MVLRLDIPVVPSGNVKINSCHPGTISVTCINIACLNVEFSTVNKQPRPISLHAPFRRTELKKRKCSNVVRLLFSILVAGWIKAMYREHLTGNEKAASPRRKKQKSPLLSDSRRQVHSPSMNNFSFCVAALLWLDQ